MPNVPASGPRPTKITKTIAQRSTGIVRIPAAMKRAKPEIQVEKRRRVPRMLKGSEARKPSRVPANDISTVSQRAALAVGSMPRSGGTISDPRMPKLRKPRASLSMSKKPRCASTASRKTAVVRGRAIVDLTKPPPASSREFHCR